MGRRKKSIVWMATAVFLVTAGFDASGQDVKPSAEIAALPEDETEELSPKEELVSLLKDQEFPGGAAAAALRETLDTGRMAENGEQNGLDTSLALFLTEDALETAELGGKPEDHKLELRFQNNVEQNRWNLSGGFTFEKRKLADFSLYADQDKLTFSFPQLYAGAVGIRSGSLLQQYRGSALSQMLGELPLTQDIELAFVPGEEGFWQEYAAGGRDLIEKYREAIDDLAADLQVEKAENRDMDVYTVVLPTEALEDFYLYMAKAHLDEMEKLHLVSGCEAEEYREELLGAKASGMFDGMGEEIVNGQIRVRDGVIQDISLEIQLEEGVSLLLNGSLQNTSLELEASLRAGEEEIELGNVRIRSASGKDSAMDRIEGNICYGETGEYFVAFEMETYFDRAAGTFWQELERRDSTGQIYSLSMDGSFRQIVPGESFLCDIESLALSDESDSLKIGMEIQADVSGKEVEEPGNVRLLTEMSQEELEGWMGEMLGNMESLNELWGSVLS